jgi:hypothetical protein
MSRDAWALATRPEALVSYAFAYNWASFDVCVSDVRVDLQSAGIARLTSRLQPASAEWNTIIGCGGAPKARLVRGAGSVSDGSVQLSPSPTAESGENVRVTRFSANHVAMDVTVSGADDAWLVYADGYHPAWTASVDGEPAAVYAAFDGEKAVKLPAGQHVVRFDFRRPLASLVLYGFALYGVGFSMAVLFVMVRVAGSG